MWGMHADGMIAGWVVGIAATLSVPYAGESLAAERSAKAIVDDRVALFEAIEAGEIAVTVIPQRAERVTLQIANKTERPLSIEIPEALAAGPVLAQLPRGELPRRGELRIGEDRVRARQVGGPHAEQALERRVGGRHVPRHVVHDGAQRRLRVERVRQVVPGDRGGR